MGPTANRQQYTDVDARADVPCGADLAAGATMRCRLRRVLLVVLVLMPGCQSLTASHLALVQLPTRAVVDDDRRLVWEAWGRQYLQDGDILFVKGESRVLMGLLNFSDFSAEIADSDFSHVGIVAIEDGVPVVYDVTSEGALRRPFGAYMVDSRVWAVAVKRLGLNDRQSIPAALAFCRRVYQDGNRFDEAFDPHNDRYYCAEHVEFAFRAGGQPLSEPVRIDGLPNFGQLSPSTVLLIETMTALRRDRPVFMPGNDHYGLWSSPVLIPVLPMTDAYAPPPNMHQPAAATADNR